MKKKIQNFSYLNTSCLYQHTHTHTHTDTHTHTHTHANTENYLCGLRAKEDLEEDFISAILVFTFTAFK